MSSSSENGAGGMDSYSWTFDARFGYVTHRGSTSNSNRSKQVRDGDVVGCLLSLSSTVKTMKFFRNDQSVDRQFQPSDFEEQDTRFCPCLSVGKETVVRVVFKEEDMKHLASVRKRVPNVLVIQPGPDPPVQVDISLSLLICI